MLICIPLSGISQTMHTSNIHYRIIDQRIEIFYDLPQNIDTLSISIVFKKKSETNFRYYPKFVSGDIGKGVFSGKNHKIIWRIENEPANVFTGSGFYFKITAEIIPPKEDLIKK
ncbi:MAG: hypothetical protein Q7U54_03560 [Bacteroidales bacterium]|nr:hypothetical protein [Bacteroidales bacterium]